jgi:hypothetical protein
MSVRTVALVWLLATLACAAVTFYYFDHYPAFAHGSRGPPLLAARMFTLAFLFVSAPFLCLLALVTREAGPVAALDSHVAIYAVFLFITAAADSPGHSSPAEIGSGAILLLLFVVLGVEVLAALVAHGRMEDPAGHSGCRPFIFIGVSTALFGGWLLGVLAWSAVLVPQVIAAAEAAAGDRPYCVDVDGRAARSAFDLSALRMHGSNNGGWTVNFHALLVVGAGADRAYMNWSYRSGRFEPLNEAARASLHLDAQAKCAPVAHFAASWM